MKIPCHHLGTSSEFLDPLKEIMPNEIKFFTEFEYQENLLKDLRPINLDIINSNSSCALTASHERFIIGVGKRGIKNL